MPSPRGLGESLVDRQEFRQERHKAGRAFYSRRHLHADELIDGCLGPFVLRRSVDLRPAVGTDGSMSRSPGLMSFSLEGKIVKIQLPFRPGLTLQMSEFGAPAKNKIEIHLITADEQMADIFRLRYQGYQEAGHIESSETKTYSDTFDTLPSTFQIAAFDGQRYIAAMRICFSEPAIAGSTLPCELFYPEVQDIKKRAHGPVVEVGRLAIEPSLQNYSYRTTIYAALVRSALLTCFACDVKVLLAGAQLKSQNFYQKILGFKVAAKPRLYPPGNEPIILLSRDLAASSPARTGLNPFFKISPADLGKVQEILTPLLSWRHYQLAREPSHVS